MTKQEAGGERIIISAGQWKWQDFGKFFYLRLYDKWDFPYSCFLVL